MENFQGAFLKVGVTVCLISEVENMLKMCIFITSIDLNQDSETKSLKRPDPFVTNMYNLISPLTLDIRLSSLVDLLIAHTKQQNVDFWVI